VEDHGIGIEKENLPRIFDRFYHLERSGDDLFGGIGLGLAITRQVIEQHHGNRACQISQAPPCPGMRQASAG
jgi:signal transduction histidine kinase